MVTWTYGRETGQVPLAGQKRGCGRLNLTFSANWRQLGNFQQALGYAAWLVAWRCDQIVGNGATAIFESASCSKAPQFSRMEFCGRQLLLHFRVWRFTNSSSSSRVSRA